MFIIEVFEEFNIDFVVVCFNEEIFKFIVEKFLEFKKSVLEKFGKEVEIMVGELISIIGGVLVESFDGSVRVDNIFEVRIERFEVDLRVRIVKVFFG